MDIKHCSDPEQPANTEAVFVTGGSPSSEVDLERILTAWNSATEKLQQTHHTLRAEVKRLTDELEIKNRELARKNRLADLGQMASHIAHEVRNSLMPMTLYSSLIRRQFASSDAGTDIVDKLDSGLKALDATVNDLLHFTSEREPRKFRFPLRALAEEVCSSLAPQCAAQAIDVDIGLPQDFDVSADREMLRRALLNLVLNALDAMPAGGNLEIRGQTYPHGSELVVSDTGSGIAPAEQHHLFEPFYTTKGSGTGLGLAIVERIVTAHGGTVKVRNVAPHGVAFSLVLPNCQGESASAGQRRKQPLNPSLIGYEDHLQRKAVA